MWTYDRQRSASGEKLSPFVPRQAIYCSVSQISFLSIFSIAILIKLSYRKTLDAPVSTCFDCQGCSNLFPANPIALPAGNISDEGFSRYGRYRCPVCSQDFCSECNVFIHDAFHVCPACGLQQP